MLCSPAVAQPFFCKPFGGLYSLPYLGEQPTKAAEALSRAEWWELLFFVKKLEAQEQKEITCLIQQDRGEQVWARACSGETRGGRTLGKGPGLQEETASVSCAGAEMGLSCVCKCELCSLSGAEMGLKCEGEWGMAKARGAGHSKGEVGGNAASHDPVRVTVSSKVWVGEQAQEVILPVAVGW